MKRMWMSGAAVLMAVSVAGLNAQSTGSQPPQTPQTQTSRPTTGTEMHAAATTLRGCVYKEQDVPGRAPNVAERAGVMEDYILVASDSAAAGTTGGMTGATPPATTPPTTPPATPPTATPPATAGTSGTAAMHAGKAFKLEKVADEQLKTLVGKMVEVTGKIDAERGDTTRGTAGTTGTAGAPARDKSLGPDRIELPEFEVTSIREVEGTCPPVPNIKK